MVILFVEIGLGKGVIFVKIGLGKGAILNMLAADPYPKFGQEPPRGKFSKQMGTALTFKMVTSLFENHMIFGYFKEFRLKTKLFFKKC